MKKLIIYCILPLFFLCSCQKDKTRHTVVKGKVINFGSKGPVEGVEVILQDGVDASNWMGAGVTSSDKKSIAITDANGEFSVELKGEHVAYIGCRKEGYSFEYVQEGSVIGIKPYAEGVHENQILEIKARAFFDGVFYSKEERISSDSLNICLCCCGNVVTNRKISCNGAKRICKFHGEYLGIGDTYLNYRVDYTRDGQWYSISDSIYLKSLETIRDTIYY